MKIWKSTPSRFLPHCCILLPSTILKRVRQILDHLRTKRLSTGVPITDYDQAAQDPQVAALLETRIARLTELGNLFLNTILASLDDVPFGIRWICKQIRELTIVHFFSWLLLEK